MIVHIFVDTPEKNCRYWAKQYYNTYLKVAKLFKIPIEGKYHPAADYVRLIFDDSNRIDAYFYPKEEMVMMFGEEELEYIVWRGGSIWQMFTEIARLYFTHFLVEETEARPDVTTELEECLQVIG